MDKFNQSINNISGWENSNTLEFYGGCSCSGGWNGYQGGMGNAYCGGNAMSNGYGGDNKKDKEKSLKHTMIGL